jgi:hypothetical protein
LYSEQGKFAEAEELYKRALAGYEKALGRDHKSTLDTAYNMAKLMEKQDYPSTTKESQCKEGLLEKSTTTVEIKDGLSSKSEW